MRLIKSMITFHGDYFPLSDPWANRAGDVAEYFVSLWTLLEWCCDMGDVGLWHHWNICWVWHQARVTCHVVTSRDVTWHIWLKHQHTPNTWGNQYTLTSPRIGIKSIKQHHNSNCGITRMEITLFEAYCLEIEQLWPVVCVVMTLCPWLPDYPASIHPLCHKTENYPQSEPASNYVPWGEYR